MASFARTIKSPYLSPRLRPSMPGRSMSTNSDHSNSPQSPRSDEIIGEFDLSGRNTPAIPSKRRNQPRDGFFDLDDIDSRTSYFSVSDLNLFTAGRRGYPPADDPGRRRAVLNPAAGIASHLAKSSEARHVLLLKLGSAPKVPLNEPKRLW
uniref:Uncharacterized protein n=1 Tax=Fusarium oxysporum (strain Fo5176) TaxID=660025 RepID=A0A0D2XID3_FUSOF